MTPFFKGFLWVALIIVCFGMMVKHARANENYDDFRAIMEDKMMIHNGTCAVDDRGNVVKSSEQKAEVPCKAGIDPSEPTIHFIVIYDESGEAEKIVKLDTTTWKQEVVWKHRMGRSA